MPRIFIYGAPGAGKTSTSRRLKLLLNYPLLEGDYLKWCIATLVKSQAEDPFLHLGTKEAWTRFGQLTEENVARGLLAVRTSMKPFLDNELALYGDDLIVEASFLDPAYSWSGSAFLVVSADAAQHRSRFFRERECDAQGLTDFIAARLLQRHLIDEVRNLPISAVANDSDPESLAAAIQATLTDRRRVTADAAASLPPPSPRGH
ncbi:hypothetical protein Cs7R123_32370 [Catellatospora sp. TT07R-123]|uniref:hypothetical protein n=1 Tax=Catellatospora sp. TT07R-123 TaxID=2733863 RepID=UPI001B2E9E5F|nr:hypothetical protein [Catellatospora sp. TT07R-123]GHJ45895.1 hypothetical protein Cs7R123_32370 [Catellatospora sp. TT07R-123]